MRDLTHLADLLHIRNSADQRIARLIGRPAHRGHIGEYIAGNIFGIDLHVSAAFKGSDGLFREGALAGQSVNIKFYGNFGGLLDLVPSDNHLHHANNYLILTGPSAPPTSSSGHHAPTVISSVYLFSTEKLIADLQAFPKMVKLGVATSVRKHLWDAAMIYPEQVSQTLILTAEQRAALALFAPAP